MDPLSMDGLCVQSAVWMSSFGVYRSSDGSKALERMLCSTSWTVSGTAGAVVTSAGGRGADMDAKNTPREVAEWFQLISTVAPPCGEPRLSSSETSGNPVGRGKKMLVFGGYVSTVFNSAVCTDHKRLRSRFAPVS